MYGTRGVQALVTWRWPPTCQRAYLTRLKKSIGYTIS